MATNNKKIINGIIIGVLGLGIIGGAVYWIWFRDKCDPNKKGFTKKGKISEKCVGETNNANTNPNTETTPPPTGCKWVSDNTFPLKRCMIGNRIGALQTALGFTGLDVDKKFGGDTLGAVQNKFGGRSEVTEAEYNALINPPATGGGSNYANLKKALGSSGKNFSGGIIAVTQGANKTYQFEFYTNGRVIIFDAVTQKELRRGNYLNGGKEIVIDKQYGDEETEQSGVFLAMKDIVNQIEE